MFSTLEGVVAPTLIWLDQSSPVFGDLFLRSPSAPTTVGADGERSRGLGFLSQGSFFSRLSLPRRGGRPDRDATLRRLFNLIFACWLTHEMIRQGLPLSTRRLSTGDCGPKGGPRVPPIRTHVAARPAVPPV